MNKFLLLVFALISTFGFSQTSCWKEISSLGSHTLAIKNDGTLWAWGDNSYGQLGNNTTINSSTPIQISSLTNWQQISAGSEQSFAIKSDGTLWVWGYNNGGILGISTSINSKIPIQLGSLTNWKSVYAGTYYCFATTSNDTLWGWGGNYSGQLGLGNNTAIITTPTQIGTASWKVISASYDFTVGIKNDGTLWSWGLNDRGQLGDGTVINKNIPVLIGGISTDWKQIDSGYYHTVGVKNNGTLWAWGNNQYGQFGNGTVGISSTNPNQVGTNPIQIGTATNWKSTNVGGQYSTAIKSDNTIWTWGINNYGVLGNGNTNNSSIPNQVGILNNWSKIVASDFNVYSINSNFDLYSWGQNYSNSPSTISCTSLGISENSWNQFIIYPNPVKEEINLLNTEYIEFEIFDILGSTVLRGNSIENKINVSSLTKGIYILKLKNEQNIMTQKFLKE